MLTHQMSEQPHVSMNHSGCVIHYTWKRQQQDVSCTVPEQLPQNVQQDSALLDTPFEVRSGMPGRGQNNCQKIFRLDAALLDMLFPLPPFSSFVGVGRIGPLTSSGPCRVYEASLKVFACSSVLSGNFEVVLSVFKILTTSSKASAEKNPDVAADAELCANRSWRKCWAMLLRTLTNNILHRMDRKLGLSAWRCCLAFAQLAIVQTLSVAHVEQGLDGTAIAKLGPAGSCHEAGGYAGQHYWEICNPKPQESQHFSTGCHDGGTSRAWLIF